ncbi:hypothetical protein TUBRATIS_008560 [Tubulinosema ratisbonensis]|uniref:Peptidase M48 domain-containing protein n=1 Tax=Tubulinosema ratisbonensis TaxID=291195 RepID=A0A437ANJ4_9MICR|nr:hypothetical protein TUBRATIS_008560 [Tubulinosema ratisbonensis]
MLKTSTSKLIIFLLAIYFTILIYTLLDLIRYRSNLKYEKFLFKNDTVNKYIDGKNETIFRQKELINVKYFAIIVLSDLALISIILFFNIIFYKEKTRDFAIKKIKRFLNMTHLLDHTNEINSFYFVGIIFVFIFLVSLTPSLPTLNRIVVYLCYICILVCYREHFFDDYFKFFKAYLILPIAIISLVIALMLIRLTMYISFKSYKGKIPLFLNKEALKLAVNFFKKENIYYVAEEEANMMTSVSFITNILIITGEWGQYSNKEIASIIAHEIGHGGVFAKYIIFFCEFLIKTIAVFLFLKVIENLVKNLKSTIDTRKLKVFFVYLNLYILRLLLTLLNNIFSQTIEYHADKMSIKIMKNDHSLQNMLFKMFINQNNFFYLNKIYSFFKKDHPSFYHRIIALENLK